MRGGRRHKRSGHKRSGHKRSGHKKLGNPFGVIQRMTGSILPRLEHGLERVGSQVLSKSMGVQRMTRRFVNQFSRKRKGTARRR